MMTIKGFAQLCQCSAQTLRYYDQVGLLKPARVDEWSGYRYYDEKQAVDFVKIKNLQAADFTIEEIKALLTQPDEAIYDAFEQKITAQQEKLRQIIQIQQTYLREKNSMEKIFQNMTSFILSHCRKPELLQEFGHTPQDCDRIMEVLRTWMEAELSSSCQAADDLALQINSELIRDRDQIASRIAQLNSSNLQDTILLKNVMETVAAQEDPGQHETVWEKHGWAHAGDFLDEMPPLTGDKDYLFSFCLTDPTLREDLSFPMFMMGIMLLRYGPSVCLQGCNVTESTDGVNHLVLSRKE